MAAVPSRNRKPRPISGHVFRIELARGPVWRAKYRLPDGRQVQRTIGPAWTQRGRPTAGHFTKRTAEAWLRDVLDQARLGTLPGLVKTGETIAEACDEYMEWLRGDQQRKPTTIRDYESIIRVHILPAFGDTKIEDLTAEDVEVFKAGLAMSNRTKIKVLTVLHGIMRRAGKRHRIPHNVVRDVDKPRQLKRSGEINVFTPEEVRALVRAASSEQDAAIYLTAAFTGLRRGELIALLWRDVDFAGHHVRVRASYSERHLTTPKSGKVRSVPMAPDVARVLDALSRRGFCDGDDNVVFAGIDGGYLDGSALYRRYKLALKEAGLRELRFHDLRHTFGTTMIRNASILQVKEWMGHADVDTTMQYLHYSPRAEDAQLVAAAFAAAEPDPLLAATLDSHVPSLSPGRV